MVHLILFSPRLPQRAVCTHCLNSPFLIVFSYPCSLAAPNPSFLGSLPASPGVKSSGLFTVPVLPGLSAAFETGNHPLLEIFSSLVSMSLHSVPSLLSPCPSPTPGSPVSGPPRILSSLLFALHTCPSTHSASCCPNADVPQWPRFTFHSKCPKPAHLPPVPCSPP